jgi:molecular chaperone DnaJ
MRENHYLTLGISPDATISEIKNAYRKLAKKFHPDHHGADSVPFLHIQEAYYVLSNPARKKSYDLSLRLRRKNRPIPGSRPAEDFPAGEVEPLIPGRRQAPSVSPFSSPAPFGSTHHPPRDPFFHFPRYQTAAADNPHVTIYLDAGRALQGGLVRLRIPALLRCPFCGGAGIVKGNACRRCSGEGAVSTTYPVTIFYPPGMPRNHTVRVPLHRIGISRGFLTVRFRIW